MIQRTLIQGHLTDPVVLREILSPEDFELHGFTVFHAVDVTEFEIVSDLERDLIDQELPRFYWGNSILSPPNNETGNLDRVQLFASLPNSHGSDQDEPANEIRLVQDEIEADLATH